MTQSFLKMTIFLVTTFTFNVFAKAITMEYPNAITPQAAQTLISEGSAVLIDVREQSEVALGMAAPALWYAKSSIDSNLQGFVDFLSQYNGKKIIIYCRSGHRASVVIQNLTTKNIEAFNMGGFQSWVDAGLPIKTPTF
jgi:rhodanese-related sulfurtransferase